MYQINTLYTLNLHSVTCQLYLSKASVKKRKLWEWRYIQMTGGTQKGDSSNDKEKHNMYGQNRTWTFVDVDKYCDLQ